MNFRPLSALFLGLLVAAAPLRAAPFTADLAPARRTQAGLDRLSDAERAALDRQVAREVRAARAGGVTAFAGTFVGRRSAAERAEAGLDRLSASERSTLDDAVAAALAAPATPAPAVSALRGSSTEILARDPKPIVHGEVTLTVGTGRDGSFQAASVYTEVTDPERRMTVGLGVSTFRGRGGWYGRPYPGGYCDGW